VTLPVPTEDVEQRIFVQWLEWKGYRFTSVPNSTYTKSWSQKRKNTATGLRAGFPDMIVIANDKFMCVEMKRTVGGSTTPQQKEWVEALNIANIPAAVCKGSSQAIDFVEGIINSSR